jgi:glycosyltransferase involved in cell wall biosynthesis
MKLSFVIPAHNEEACIGKCLSSILSHASGKKYDVEIIVVNNASTDKTKEVASSFPGVKIVDEPRKSLARARNSGYLASSGDLIANVDADTILPQEWINKVLREFGEDEELIALSGPMVFYDIARAMMKLQVRLFYYLGFISYIANRYVFRAASMLQGGNFVVRRRAMDKIGGYNLQYGFGEDADLSRRLHKVGKVKFTFKLPMYASGRRIAKEGAFTMSLRYGLQYFWTVIFKKPFTQYFPDIRTGNDGGRLEYKPQNKIKEWIIAASYIVILVLVLGSVGYLSYYVVYHGVANVHVADRIKAGAAKLDAEASAFFGEVVGAAATKLNFNEPGK